MSFNAKEAAEKLFEIADIMEKQASQQTFFVCEGCNHTANLETINSVRTKFASENSIESASSVSVDSVINCKACGGDMKYAATEESEKFFVEAAEKKSEDVADAEIGEEPIENDIVADPSEDDTEEVAEEVSDETIEAPVDEPAEKEEKRTTKDKEDTDGKVEKKEEPKVQFGDGEKKASKTAAFEKAVDRYSNS